MLKDFYKDSKKVDNENHIAVKHRTKTGGKYDKPSFGQAGNLVILETRYKTEKQRLPSDEQKKNKIIHFETLY